jgi:hypothetical protein
MFSDIVLNIETTKTFFHRVIEYNNGNCCFKVKSPNHLFSQERILNPQQAAPKLGVPLYLLHMCYDLSLKYFFLTMFCPRPSLFINLNNHLLSKHLLCISICLLILWLTYNIPSCQHIFLFILITLQIET